MVHFYIFASLCTGTHVFMHASICIYIIYIHVEEGESRARHLEEGRNTVNFGHSLTKRTPKKDQIRGGKIVSLISEAHEKFNLKCL